MVKKTNNPIFQFCIFETYVNEVLALDKRLQLDEITFEMGFSLKRIVSNIPVRLAELGVRSLRQPATSMEASGLLTGKRKHMEECATSICDSLKLDYRHMKVRRVVVTLGDATATFTRMTKRMVGTEGKSYDVKVLGHVVTEGTEQASKAIIKVLGAKKVHCQYSVQPIRTVLCTT